QGRQAGIRRFVYDHAKYMVIDDASLLIGSENYSPTGQPSAGHIGNRGWEVLIHDPVLAKDFSTVFTGDDATSNRDIHSYVGVRHFNYFIQSPDGSSYTGEYVDRSRRIPPSLDMVTATG